MNLFISVSTLKLLSAQFQRPHELLITLILTIIIVMIVIPHAGTVHLHVGPCN